MKFLFFVFSLFLIQCQVFAERDDSALAIQAIQNYFPQGKYISKSTLVTLLRDADSFPNGIMVSKPAGVLQSESAYCSVSIDWMTQSVHFLENDNGFEINTFGKNQEFICKISFNGKKLTVKTKELELSLRSPCQTKESDLSGGINWTLRKTAKNPQPLCKGIEDIL